MLQTLDYTSCSSNKKIRIFLDSVQYIFFWNCSDNSRKKWLFSALGWYCKGFEGFEPCLSHLPEGPNCYSEPEHSDLILDFESVRQWAPKYSLNLPNGSPSLVRQKNLAFGPHLQSIL